MGDHFKIEKMLITHRKTGSEFVFKGIRQNIANIKSFEGADYCWVEEADSTSENSWRTLIPTIRKEGSEIWVTFNPNNKSDATYRRFITHPPKDAWIRKVTWRDNEWFPSVLHAEMQRDREMDEEAYQHTWEGEIRQFVDGSVYRKQLLKAQADGRVGPVPVIPGVEVNTYWDLGKNDHTAIWFIQEVGLQKRAIDFYQNRLVDLDHYIRILKKKAYNYGHHHLPHDVEHHILGMTNTRRDQLEKGGIKPIVTVPRINDLNEGVEMTRRLIPEVWLDNSRKDTLSDDDFAEGVGQDGVEYGLDALSHYRMKYDEDLDTHTKFVHDWSSNAADAFRQYAQSYRPAKFAMITEKGPVMTYRRNKRVVTVRDVV